MKWDMIPPRSRSKPIPIIQTSLHHLAVPFSNSLSSSLPFQHPEATQKTFHDSEIHKITLSHALLTKVFHEQFKRILKRVIAESLPLHSKFLPQATQTGASKCNRHGMLIKSLKLFVKHTGRTCLPLVPHHGQCQTSETSYQVLPTKKHNGQHQWWNSR